MFDVCDDTSTKNDVGSAPLSTYFIKKLKRTSPWNFDIASHSSWSPCEFFAYSVNFVNNLFISNTQCFILAADGTFSSQIIIDMFIPSAAMYAFMSPRFKSSSGVSSKRDTVLTLTPILSAISFCVSFLRTRSFSRSATRLVALLCLSISWRILSSPVRSNTNLSKLLIFLFPS